MKRILIILLCALCFTACTKAEAPSSKPDFTAVPPNSSESTPPADDNSAPIQSSIGYKAMWISYLEWSSLDTSSLQAFTADIAKMLDNCLRVGANRVIVQVRPFSDAIYESALFPKSHLLTGTQGIGTDFDAFKVIIDEVRSREMTIEAWINPYRIALNSKTPGSYAESNLKSTHPEWVKEANGGLYLEPSNPEVQQYIIDGVKEVCEIYDIDGIQFDDYFYPTTDASFDESEYNALGGGNALDEWRRDNVNTLIKNVYSAIKEINPDLIFGISPQGNNDNNYNQQYSDVALWLSQKGYVDYIMPQIYWGFNYETKSGSKRYQFESLSTEWGAMPRAEGVKLYVGLGIYRIGAGDGGANAQDEWQSGHNIADMVTALSNTSGVDGWAMYRYDSLFNNTEYAALCENEIAALEAIK